jgi:predicted transcriptional regulator
MPRPPTTLPTSSELEILHVIWERGRSTVRAVYRTLAERRQIPELLDRLDARDR